MLAIIGGSGLSRLAVLESVERRSVGTPFGETSAQLTTGRLDGNEVMFLPRHGDAHSLPPHRINYRANIWALKEAGAEGVIAIATVGGIRGAFGPGTIVVPQQIIDYTWGRPSTFFEGQGDAVTHVDFTEPYSAPLRSRILEAARRAGEPVFDGGVYGATQGPRLESAAEIDRMERDGADLVGMTGMPEAALARELGLPYAAIAVVVNHAAGRGDSAQGIALAQLEAVLAATIERVLKVVRAAVTGR
jgi:5'-methylthioadenosine phosphorylase